VATIPTSTTVPSATTTTAGPLGLGNLGLPLPL
jgi:hypothetical protein